MSKTLPKPRAEKPRSVARKGREESVFLLVTSKTYRDFNALASQPLGRAEEDLVTTPKR